MSLLAQLDQRIRHHGGLIFSCQPVPISEATIEAGRVTIWGEA